MYSRTLRYFFGFFFGGYVFSKLASIIILLAFHKHVYNHHPGTCKAIEGTVNGSETIRLLPGGLAVISSGLRFLTRANPAYEGRKGYLLYVDLSHPEHGAQPFKMINFKQTPEIFNPQGLSVFKDSVKRQVLLYVVNHAGDESVVEKFKVNVAQRSLTYKATLGRNQNTMRTLNDIVVIAEDQFYYTNFLYSRQAQELLLDIQWGSLGFFNGHEGVLMGVGLGAPNGVAVSKDKQYVYVGVSNDQAVYAFRRSPNNSLHIHQIFPVYTYAGNLYVHPKTGDIYMACQPKLWKLLVYGSDPAASIAPSMILRMRAEKGKIYEMTQVFADDGALISASSAAVRYKDKLLVGSLSSSAVICELS